MQLKRAIELCEEPLAASKSHIVHVNRHALRLILDDRTENIKQRETEKAAAAATIAKLKKDLEKKDEELAESEKKTKLVEIQLKECQQLVEAVPIG